jgi:hypothetical protein
MLPPARRADRTWNPTTGYADDEAPTGQSSERMRLARLWLRAGDYFSEAELLVLLEFLEGWRDCSPAARATALSLVLGSDRPGGRGGNAAPVWHVVVPENPDIPRRRP